MKYSVLNKIPDVFKRGFFLPREKDRVLILRCLQGVTFGLQASGKAELNETIHRSWWLLLDA